ncbi:hypothetical protein FNV43_RR17467 [Rhamnella rubrinervis]|uniref:Glycosyltransferase n=1 Tax=Rhamnella rubrinervis TaxID=2594499 RepID=A0A8K0E9G9_9ROSA|nr:hypothetical protein FNV43_RR17467 [Rhamnella rubrinervis]
MKSTISSMAKEESKLHIAMFPWLAFGHMTPFLELAKLIAQKGHRISFMSTPRNIDRLPKLPPTLTPFINFVKLPLPHTDNLPEDTQATTDLTPDKIPHLKNAHDRLQDSISQFLQSSKPDWVVQDFSAYWLPEIARNLGIPSVFFSIYVAASVAFSGPTLTSDDRTKPEDFTVPPYWVPFPTKVRFHLYEVLTIYDNLTEADGAVSVARSFEEVLRGVDAVAVRSCMEFEPQWLQLLQDLHQKPVFPVGVLAPRKYDGGEEDDDNDKWMPIKEWLDKQNARSVVYIAFGSEAKVKQDELTEIAHGLELSGLPFFWVLRIDGDSELPEGFEERTKGHGVVCTTWAPQLKILAHQSIGGFLTHSGFSSVVEALKFAIPLVLFPITNDQGINARLLEEKNIGFPIPRDKSDGSFTRQSVADSLRHVVVEEEGESYRDKAKEMRLLFGDEHRQDRYVNDFLAHLLTHRRPKE